jgi:hypothetical protein
VLALGSDAVPDSGSILDTNSSLVAPSVIIANIMELGAANAIGSESNLLNVTAATESLVQVVEGDAQLRNTNLSAGSVDSVIPVVALYAATGLYSSALSGASSVSSTTVSVIPITVEDDELGFIDEGVFFLPSTFTNPEGSILMPVLNDPDFPGDQRPEDPADDVVWVEYFEDVVREFIASRHLLAEDASAAKRAEVEAVLTSEMQTVIAYYDVVRERERSQLAAEEAAEQVFPEDAQQPSEQEESATPTQQGALPSEGLNLGYVGQQWSEGGIGFEVRS